MQNYRKIFSEGLNADDDFSIIGKGQWVNASNVRTFTTDNGATGRVENINGNALLSNTFPAGTNKCIGGVADETKKRIIFFNWNSNGNHGIYAYDKIATITYTILLNSQIEGGLGFDKYHRISSNAKIVGNLLQFTDNLNEPRCFNIEAAIKLNQSGYSTSEVPYAAPLKYTTLTLIKRPPIFPVTAVKVDDSSYPNNFIQDNAYQFTYRYQYRDYQISALSAYSKLVPYNAAGDTYKRIDIAIPVSEFIDDDIFAVELCVKYGNTGKTFIIKRWDKDFDPAAIAAHNTGTALSYQFFDDTIGEVLSDDVSVQSFDNIPLTSKTIEVAKDRNFIANNLSGYSTPKISSLSSNIINTTTGGGSLSGAWGYVTLHANWSSPGGCQDSYMYPFVYVASTGNFYYFPAVRASTAWNGGTDTSDLTATQNVLDATATGANEAGFITVLKLFSGYPATSGCTFGTPQWQSAYEISYDFFGVAHPVTILTTNSGVGGFFKSASTYKVSIAFYDRYRRKCGIIRQFTTNYIPERTFSQASFSAAIQWTLSNTDTGNEIPDWAYYYQIHITRNQTTRFFLQGRTKGAAYITKNQDGTFAYPSGGSTFSIGATYAIAIDISSLNAFGLGYEFTEGDLIRIGKSDDTNVLLRVIGADGKYVLCNPTDIGSLDITSTVFLIELFTPYKPVIIEPYYETGDVYTINNPGTNTRNYSTITGILNGDAYAIERKFDSSTSYFVEAMSPNDKEWQIWQTDTGWPNTIDTIGQKLLKNTIQYSNTYIQGTKVNGLNKFETLNVKDLDAENGSIQKLQLSNKQQADGTVMLAICEDECVSMYLGEQELLDTQGSAFIAQAKDVIGSVRALKGSMGTSNPESIFEYNGQVFWWDVRNGSAARYADNGLFPISKYKFVKPANLFSRKFSSLSVSDIEALGSDPFIIGGFDPYHKEILFTIPSTEATPPKGFLEDYVNPQIIYPYDIYDGVGKTLVYKHEADIWMGSMSFQAEFFVKMDNDLYSFKNGALYIHNQPNSAMLYGVPIISSLMYANNPGAIHTFLSIGLESNKIPSFVHLRTEDPYVQSSDLLPSDFVTKEGVIEASILRDGLSPNVNGDYNAKQFTGDRLFGKALLTMLQYEFVNDPSKLQLRVVNTGNIINQGTLINKQ